MVGKCLPSQNRFLVFFTLAEAGFFLVFRAIALKLLHLKP
jgi:hypothetical protein